MADSNSGNRKKKRTGEAQTTPAVGPRGPEARLPRGGRAVENEMAVSVTRHTEISTDTLRGPGTPTVLAVGPDSIYWGAFVDWGDRWGLLHKNLEDGKRLAEGTQGRLFLSMGGSKTLIHPMGDPPMYRFRVTTDIGRLSIGKRSLALIDLGRVQTPNVIFRFSAETLWLNGVQGTLQLGRSYIESWGGSVLREKFSRLDLCADLELPRFIALDFLRSTVVSKTKVFRPWLNGDELESFYAGKGGNVLQVRIYNKAKEVQKNDEKRFFYAVWEVPEEANVWRIEIQMLRPFLKQIGINSVADMEDKAGGAWAYATEKFFSLRLPDNKNPTRRTVHPFWAAVQACAGEFGKVQDIKRDFSSSGTASVDWLVNHIAGCLSSYAAKLQISDPDVALEQLIREMKEKHWGRTFKEKYEIKSLKLGHRVPVDPSPEGPRS